MAREIHHRSYWGNTNPEGYGEVYYDDSATNKLYRHSDYYENSWDTDKTLRDLNNKASIVLTPTAYSDGSLNTVIPPYQVLSELVTNGTFDTDSDWNLNSGITISGGTMNFTSTAGSYGSQDIGVKNGVKYKITFEITSETSGSLTIFLGAGNNVGVISGLGKKEIIAIGSTNLDSRLYFGNVFTGSIDNVSIKEVQEADFDFSRGSSATRVNEQGLVEDVQILSGELVQNGDFEQIGSELVTNGTFDTDSDWDLTNAVIENGVGKFQESVGTYARIRQDINFTGQTKVTYTISFNNSSKTTIQLRSYGGGNNEPIPATVGTHTVYRNFTSDGINFQTGNLASDEEIHLDNVSVKEVGQNWTFGGEAIIDNGLVSFVSPSNTYSYIRQDISSLSASIYRISVEVKNYVSGAVQVGFTGSSPNLQNLNVSADGVYTIEISPNANGDDLEVSREFGGGAFDFDIDNVSIKEVTDDTDLPRIDYTDGTGSLLLEPQRTNVIENSEVTSTWTYTEYGSGSAGTITTGKTDMFGGTNAVQVDFPADAENVAFTFGQSTSSISSGSVATSVYIKLVESGSKTLQLRASSAVVSLINVNSTDFVRYEMTGTKNSVEAFNIKLRPGEGTSSGGFSIIICHPQEEAGSYATSYIPTSGSTVTRSADVANNSGNADLFNDSEGVLYAEIAALADGVEGGRISVSNGTITNYFSIDYRSTLNRLRLVYNVGGVNLIAQNVDVGRSNVNFNKIAYRYKSGEHAVYINGVSVFTSTETTTYAANTLNKIDFYVPNASSNFNGKTKCVAVFKEALSNDLLERLTGEGYESFRLLAEANNYTII